MLNTFKCKYCALNKQIKMTICTIVACTPESPRIDPFLFQYFIQLRDARFYKSHDTYRHFMIFYQVPILIGTQNKQLFNKTSCSTTLIQNIQYLRPV